MNVSARPRFAPALLLALLLLLLAPPLAEGAPRRPPPPPSPSTRIVVLLQPHAHASPVLRLVGWLGWRVLWSDQKVGVVTLSPQSALAAPTSLLLNLVGSLPGVSAVEEDLRLALGVGDDGHQSDFMAFSDELGSMSWSGQPALGQVGLSKFPRRSARGRTVAVLDGGFHRGHEALPEGQLGPGYDFVDGDADPLAPLATPRPSGAGAGLGHGLAVAALIRLAAPEVRLRLVRVMDDSGYGTVSRIVSGIEWARRAGVDAIHMSLGSPVTSDAIEEVLGRARDAGILVVASTGNQGQSPPAYPARSREVLAVASVTSKDTLDSASNVGSSVWAGAPGVDVIVPWSGSGRSYARAHGTSFAASIATGTLVLLKAQGDPDPAAALTRMMRPYASAGDRTRCAGGVLDVTRLLR